MSANRSRRFAFTMIEFLIILALLAMLLGAMLGFVVRVGYGSKQAQSMNNMRQQVLALHNCHDAFQGFPPIAGSFPAQSNTQGSLFFYLLPFLEQDNLYGQAEGSVWKNGTLGTPLSIFLDPRDKSAPPGNRYKGWLATSNYAGNWMIFKDTGGRFRDIRDGTSNTIGVAERYQVCHGQPCAWGYPGISTWTPMFGYYTKGKFQNAPTQEECNPALPQAIDKSGIQVALMDGSVRVITERISSETWWNATDPADGNPMGPDW